MADFVGCIVLFEAPSNTRSPGLVQMDEDKFLTVRQDHVDFVKRPPEECDVWSNLTLLCPGMQAPVLQGPSGLVVGLAKFEVFY